MIRKSVGFLICAVLIASVQADDARAGRELLQTQNAAQESNTNGKGYGPQSPRDLSQRDGLNLRIFSPAPVYRKMNLCNLHFHKNAEHKGGDFTTFAGDGDGQGFNSGYRYSGKLSSSELQPLEDEVCKGEHGGLQAGDTIEVHYVHSSAQVVPGPTLGSCLSEVNANPQLRVEAQVFVLVNDPRAGDFSAFAETSQRDGYHQAPNIPEDTGIPIQYAGSTTGPAYNAKGSPLHVSWSVRPKVLKVDAQSVGQWCRGNVFNEHHAQGVRNLVVDPQALSEIQ
jgi:hypothetical protein